MEFAMREGGFLRHAMASSDADDEADDDDEEDEEEDEGYVDQPASLPPSHSASPDAMERHTQNALLSAPVPRRPRPLWEVAPYLYRYRPQRKTPLLRSHSWDEAWYSREVREVARRICSLKMAGMKCPFCSKPEINFFEKVHLNRTMEANRSSKPTSNANRPGMSENQQKDTKNTAVVIRRPITATALRSIPRMGVSATERREHTFKDAVQHLDVLPVGLEMSAPREALFRSIAVPRVLALPKTVPGISSLGNNDTATIRPTPRPRQFSPAKTTSNTNDETTRHSPTSVACSINSMPNFTQSSNEDTLRRKLKNKGYEVSSTGRDLITDSCKEPLPEPLPKKAKSRKHKVRRNQHFLSTCHVYRHPATDSQGLEPMVCPSARRYLTYYDLPQPCLPRVQKVLEVVDSPVTIVGNDDLDTHATKSTDIVARCSERPPICPDKLGEDSTEDARGTPGRKHRRHSSFQLNTMGPTVNYEGDGEGSTTIQINAPGNVELRVATTKVVSVVGRTSPDVSGVEFSIRFHDQNQENYDGGGGGGQPSYCTWRRSSAPCTDITSIDKSYPVDLRGPQEVLSICNDNQDNSTEVDFDSSLYCRDKFLRNRAVFVGQESKTGTNVNRQSADSDNKPGTVKLGRECNSVGQCHLPNDRSYTTCVTSAEAMLQDFALRRAIDSQSHEFDFHSPAHAQVYQVRHKEQPKEVTQSVFGPHKFEIEKPTIAPPNSSIASLTKETTRINTPRCYGDKADSLGGCGAREGDAGCVSNLGTVKEPFSTDVMDLSAYFDIRHKVLEAKHLMDEVFNKIHQNGEDAGVGCKNTPVKKLGEQDTSFPNCCNEFPNSPTFFSCTPGKGASNRANLDTQSTRPTYLAHRWETDYAPALETRAGLKAVSPDTDTKSSLRCGNTADWPGASGKMRPCQSCSPRPATMSSHQQESEAGPGASGCQQNGWPGEAYSILEPTSLRHTGTGLPSAQPWNRNLTDRNKERKHHSLTSPDKTTTKQSLSLEDDAINNDQPECEDDEVADILSVVNYTEQVNRMTVLNEAMPDASSPFASVCWSRDTRLEQKKQTTEISVGRSPLRVPCEQESQEWVLAHDLEDGKPRFRPIVAELSLQEIHYGELLDGHCTAV